MVALTLVFLVVRGCHLQSEYLSPLENVEFCELFDEQLTVNSVNVVIFLKPTKKAFLFVRLRFIDKVPIKLKRCRKYAKPP